jgi:hypothetical protein
MSLWRNAGDGGSPTQVREVREEDMDGEEDKN